MISMFILNVRENQSYGFISVSHSCLISSVKRSHFLCGLVFLVKCSVNSVVQIWRGMLKVRFAFYFKSITVIVWTYVLNDYGRKK